MPHFYGNPKMSTTSSEVCCLSNDALPPVQRSLSWPMSQNVGQTPLGTSPVGSAYPCAPVGIGPMAFRTVSKLPPSGYCKGGGLP